MLFSILVVYSHVTGIKVCLRDMGIGSVINLNRDCERPLSSLQMCGRTECDAAQKSDGLLFVDFASNVEWHDGFQTGKALTK